ncbi:methyltransferase domain-containing protein [Streptomyces pinistramenti]|uniref:methyltransferase domain-containing protein n=1 Tax=Streptomyces pinistramenti TaxID=2884812 RepID=UPI001D077248|nr:methyltransferase domain-containing protein [Streptomyces pinistramenti]MCB5906118.1 methyltransferase domain-containing protein [Streptomyces pinistramenti]
MNYIIDPAWAEERERLENLAVFYNVGTAEICDRLGVGAGWRCLDLGAGSGSVVRMLAERVGPEGEVLAIDADTRFLEPLAGGPITVRTMDVTAGPLPEGRFDFVHARLLLEHLPEPAEMVRSMTAAARPGGWVVVEDVDWSTALTIDPPSEAHERVIAACHKLYAGSAYDASYGRKVPRQLREAGLTDIGIRAASMPLLADVEHGQPDWQMWVTQLAPRMLAEGLLTQDDLDAFSRLWHDGDTVGFGPLIVSAWGRRPADESAR